jgi:hypothetical protein
MLQVYSQPGILQVNQENNNQLSLVIKGDESELQ